MKMPGKSLLAERAGKAGMAALLAGTVMQGFSKGFGDRDVSSQVYDTLLGDPDADKAAFGREVSVRSLMAPIPMGRINAMKREGLAGFSAAATGGFVNPTTISNHFKNRSYYNNSNIDFSNAAPIVEGHMVLGMWDARNSS